ncbi:Putative VPS15 protein kinase [Rhizopus microsporus]|nr:Putative VPS15 protein kinase [Rhizopus microsporus]
MVQVLPINYNNEHYKPANFMNGEHNNYQHPTPPPHPHPPIQQHQQMPIPLPPVPMINHLMPHPHHPPGYFHPPPPPPHPHQPISRVTYNQQGGRIKCITFIQQTYSIASASDNGSIHIFRVDIHNAGTALKFGKCIPVREFQLQDEYALHLRHITSSK